MGVTLVEDNIEIKYVKWNLANKFSECIELNENLKKYPELHDAILKHELEHTNRTFSKKDFLLDFKGTEISSWSIFKFMLHHPRAFTQFLPVYYQKGRGWVYDINIIIMYLIYAIFIIAAAYIAFKLI